MHLKEHKISKRAEMIGYFNKNKFKLINGEAFSIGSGCEMWNSGVIGINSSELSKVKEVINLVEQITSKKPWHVAEQISFSYFLQGGGEKITPAEKYIVHYYFYKPFTYIMAIYFDAVFDEDEDIVLKFLRSKLVPSKINYNQLPAILINFLKHSFFQEWHYYILPPDTFIGKILRKHTITDKKHSFMVLKTYIKSLFSKHLVGERYYKKSA
jgi:hypothetical protein